MVRENFQMHGQASQNSFCWMKGHLTDRSGRRFTRTQTTSRSDTVWQDVWTFMSDAAEKREQNKDGLSRNQSSTMQDIWEEFSSMNRNDEEVKFTMKAARRKLEVPMPAAMFCKIPMKSSGETHRNIGKTKQNTLVLLMPTRARDQAQKELNTNLIKITLLQKGWNFFAHHSLVHSGFKNSRCNGGSVEKWWKVEKRIPALNRRRRVRHDTVLNLRVCIHMVEGVAHAGERRAS